MEKSTQFTKHRHVRHQLAQIHDKLRAAGGEMTTAEREELKAAAIVLKSIKEVLTIEQENELMKRLEALEDAISTLN
ncbi:hypothetical protein [Thiomicrorhabdus indica]|uniref:hypothetical protein n=1 Tax=Thiomicrorhabdus indica TaxID=2267253 RepID=UPI002AA6F3A1|nr:hypothetical protein [Thiomicrorhabdus indica]